MQLVRVLVLLAILATVLLTILVQDGLSQRGRRVRVRARAVPPPLAGQGARAAGRDIPR